MASVSSVLERIKSDLRPFISDQSIEGACRQAGHRWRRRQLGPVQTVHLFILQVLHFNTAMTHLRHLTRRPIKAAGYCRARMRLPLKALQILLTDSARAMQSVGTTGEALWCGLRAYLVDGSSTIAPDTPQSQKAFGQPKGCKKGCGFPVPKVLGLFDAFSGLVIEVLGFPLYTHEQSKVWMLHPRLGLGDVLVGDRGFCSFVHLAMLLARRVHGVFRIHQKTTVSFRPHRPFRRTYRKGENVNAGKPVPRSRFVRRLGKYDQIVEWFRYAAGRPKWLPKAQFKLLPQSLQVRELRFWLVRKGQRTRQVTIVTTLLDPTIYPKEKIADLYGIRWRVETHFAQLKTLLRMRKVKSKTAQGVLKELTVYALAYNLIHLVMMRAAAAQRVPPHRISFLDALRWLLSAAPDEAMPLLVVIPHRPDRHEPRVVKDREDTYTKMTRPRTKLRNALKRQPIKG